MCGMNTCVALTWPNSRKSFNKLLFSFCFLTDQRVKRAGNIVIKSFNYFNRLEVLNNVFDIQEYLRIKSSC